MTTSCLEAALQGLLQREVDRPRLQVTALQKLTGGASRETWSFRAGGERFILQRERPGNIRPGGPATEAAIIRAAREAGVPSADVLCASAEGGELGGAYLITRHVPGETIARKILRDPDFTGARMSLAFDCARALAAIHSVPVDSLPVLSCGDQLLDCRMKLDDVKESRPALELAFQWLEANRPESTGETLVHGDFRLGNLIVGSNGIRAVIDWELAHIGDPMEDLGWLCTRAWRFGGEAPVAGVAPYSNLLDAYADASGRTVDLETLRWWEVLGTLKWGIICIIQARKHLDGVSRSLELAAIGRRVCESEYDLLQLLEPKALAAATAHSSAPCPETRLHGRPTATELLDAVREWVVDDVRESDVGEFEFQTRVAENVLLILGREATIGPQMAVEHAERLAQLGVEGDQQFALRVREGSLSGDAVVQAIADSVVDRLRVANPRWFVKTP